MNLYLDDFIHTLTERRQEHVSSILEEAKVGKDELGLLAQRLVSFQSFAPLLLTTERQGERISGNRLALNFRDLDVQMRELYRVTDQASDLVNGDVAVLTSQIKALEDDLSALEHLISNYSFLLGEGGTFNFAFIEPFNDESGREDTFDFDIPDRASQAFGPGEQAQIRSDEGMLALAQNVLISSAISGQIVDANASAFVVTDNGLTNAFSATAARGWRYVVAAPTPVTSSLAEAQGQVGAQVYLEFVLNNPGPISQLKIVPFAEHPIQLVRVLLFHDNLAETNPDDVLAEPVTIAQPFTIEFSVRSVAKFRVLIAQPTYERVVDAVAGGEDEYRQIWEEFQNKRQTDPRFQYLQGIFTSRQSFNRLYAFLRVMNFLRSLRGESVLSLPDTVFDAQSGPLRVDTIMAQLQSEGGGSLDAWFPRSPSANRLDRFVAKDDGLLHILPFPVNNHTSFNPPLGNPANNVGTTSRAMTPIDAFNRGRIAPILANVFRDIANWRPVSSTGSPLDSLDIPASLFQVPATTMNPTASFNYTYYLGFEFIGVGLSAPGFKGVFVSKAYDSDGDIGEIRLKTLDFNVRLGGNRDNNLLTSIEYSVSNVSSPRHEANWTPILPVESKFIESERFFPDGTGKGFFRFPANRVTNTTLYRNGTAIDVDYIYDALGQLVLGAKLPLGQAAPTDIFTVSYTPGGDFTTVNFTTIGQGAPFLSAADLPLLTAFDADGAGEGFTGTGGSNIITLSRTPYIDEQLIQQSLQQKVPTYQPITIVFANGDVGQNLTNYGTGAQVPLPPPPTPIPAFLQSGTSIIFNDSITQSFRVFYQYLQNNVRTRVVLRVDDPTFVSPKVDYVQIKAKTRRGNPAGSLS